MLDKVNFSYWLHFLEILLKGITVLLLMVIVIQQIMIESILTNGPLNEYAHPGPHLRLLKSLHVAAKMYTSQQKTEPEVFSNFIVDKGPIPEGYTLSLQDKRRFISGLKDMNSRIMTVQFVNGTHAQYYLTGSDVTADF